MKLTTDPENNVGYLALCEIADGEVDRTVTVYPSVNLDFDAEGALLGIEFLDAKVGMARLRSDLAGDDL